MDIETKARTIRELYNEVKNLRKAECMIRDGASLTLHMLKIGEFDTESFDIIIKDNNLVYDIIIDQTKRILSELERLINTESKE